MNADGDVVSVSVTEPRFTPDEVGLLLAARRLELSRNDYGIPRDVAMDADNQWGFKIVGPRMDWAEETVRRAKVAYKQSNPDADMSSLHWSVELKD